MVYKSDFLMYIKVMNLEVIFMEKYKHIKISIFLVDIGFVALSVLTLTLPFLVNWYVEVMHRSETLASTVMLTSYPCVPFVFMALLSLRRFLKCIMYGEIFTIENIKNLKVFLISCIAIALITFVAGFFYMPFFFIGLTFSFVSVLVYSLRAIAKCEVKKEVAEEETKED